MARQGARGKGRQAFVQRLSMAEMAEAEKAWPHSSSVIAFTFLVETPCTYISASVATSACLGALIAFKEFGREAAVAVLRRAQLKLAAAVTRVRGGRS